MPLRSIATLAALLTWLAATPQPSFPVYIRPESAEPVAEIGNELAARDNDPNGTNTWATRVFNRSCTPIGGCVGVSSAATVWQGFPAGYRPGKLVVYWKASSSVMMFGGSSQVRAFVEYSTGGTVWTPIAQFVQNGTQFTDTMTPAEATLAPTIDPAAVKVRGRLEVEMIGCPNAECAANANLPNPSNLSGQIWISDIRMEVEAPVLTASHERVARGETVTFSVTGAPGARISNWKFMPASGAVQTRADRHSDATWPLTVPDSGTVTVTVELNGQVQLNGRRFELTKAIGVRSLPARRYNERHGKRHLLLETHLNDLP